MLFQRLEISKISKIVDALSKIGKNFRFKHKQPLLMKSGIAYKLTCSCGCTCVGQTRRNLLSRIKKLATTKKSEVCKHLLQNSTCTPESYNALILIHPRF